jgi:hypothetical protein
MTVTLDRNLSTNTNTEVKKSNLVAAVILYLDFPSIFKYYAGTTNNIILGSSTVMPAGIYVGVGGISSVTVVEESSEMKSTKLVAELNGLDETYISLVLGQQYFGRDASFGMAVLDSDYRIIGEPILLFKGYMSLLTADIDSSTKISVEIESILADWERPRVKRYNSATQNEIDNTDEGFDNVAAIVNKEVTWG